MGFNEVSNILWRERQLLELLLFKLEEEQLLLAAGKSRWLSHATREVEMVIDELKQTELRRAIEVDALAASMSIGSNPSLSELAEKAPAPWDKLLMDHRRAFLGATQDILTLAQANRNLLSQGQSAAREALAWLGDDIDDDMYSPKDKKSGSTSSARPQLVNKAV